MPPRTTSRNRLPLRQRRRNLLPLARHLWDLSARLGLREDHWGGCRRLLLRKNHSVQRDRSALRRRRARMVLKGSPLGRRADSRRRLVDEAEDSHHACRTDRRHRRRRHEGPLARPEEEEGVKEGHRLVRDDPARRGNPRRSKKVLLLHGEVGTPTTRAAAGNRHRIGIRRRREEGRLDPDHGDLLLVVDRRTSSILVVQKVQVSQASREVLRRRATRSRSDYSTTRAADLHSGQAAVLFLLLRRAAGVRKAASAPWRKKRREELRYYRTELEGEDRAGEAAAAVGGGGTAARFRTPPPPQQKKKTTSRTSCACKAERRASLNRVLLLRLLLLLSQSSLGCMVTRREVLLLLLLLLLRTGTW